MATAEALKNNKAWLVPGRSISSITLVDDQGDVLYHYPLPWLCATTDEGSTKLDIVGCRHLSRARVVDDLRQVGRYKVGHPILLRHRLDMSDIDDRQNMFVDYHLYLPIERWRWNENGHIQLPAIAELAGVHEPEPERFYIDEFIVHRVARA